MTDEEFKKFKVRIAGLGPKYGYGPDEAEDITQEVMLMWAERGFRTGQTLEQAIIDCLRKQSGRKGSDSYTARTELKNAASIDDVFEYTGLAGPDMAERESLGSYVRYLKPVEQFVLTMMVDGYNQKSIADELGVTESRVCQRMKSIREVIGRSHYDEFELYEFLSELNLTEETKRWVIKTL